MEGAANGATTGAWQRAVRALELLAVDPAGLGGLWLRARSGPVRDRYVAALPALPLGLRKLHPAIGDDALFGLHDCLHLPQEPWVDAAELVDFFKRCADPHGLCNLKQPVGPRCA